MNTATRTQSKYYISVDTGCVYWLEEDGLFSDEHKDPKDKALFYAPINRNNTFDPDNEGNTVEEDLVGDEHIYSPDAEPLNFKTFSELYAEVRKALTA